MRLPELTGIKTIRQLRSSGKEIELGNAGVGGAGRAEDGQGCHALSIKELRPGSRVAGLPTSRGQRFHVKVTTAVKRHPVLWDGREEERCDSGSARMRRKINREETRPGTATPSSD